MRERDGIVLLVTAQGEEFTYGRSKARSHVTLAAYKIQVRSVHKVYAAICISECAIRGAHRPV